MRFSIVIIALNEERYIGTLLNCLTEQTYKDFEVIVVDGKSEDRTVEVVNEFTEKLALTIIESDKRGPSYQRNLGVRAAKNEDIVFFDADVAITNDFLEKLQDFLDKYNVGSVTGLYKPLESSVYNHWSMFIQNIYILLREHIYPVATGAFMYFSKSSFNKLGGFDETIIYAEDSELVQRVWKSGDGFKVMKKPKVYFSCRRLERDGKFKHSFWLIWAQLRLMFGAKYGEKEKNKYKFGHYNKD